MLFSFNLWKVISKMDISPEPKHAIIQYCLSNFDDVRNRLRNGVARHISEDFGIHEVTVLKLWMKYRQQIEAGVLVPDFNPQRKGHCGRKTKLTEPVKQQYKAVAQEYADLHIRLNGRLMNTYCSTEASKTEVSAGSSGQKSRFGSCHASIQVPARHNSCR